MQVTPNDVAFLLEWRSEKGEGKLTCCVSDTACLPDKWGKRATEHVREFLETHSVVVNRISDDRYMGLIRETADVIAPEYRKTNPDTLRTVLVDISTRIAYRINQKLQDDWNNDVWETTAAAANRIMSEMARDMQGDMS